jgi:hypothetical protein
VRNKIIAMAMVSLFTSNAYSQYQGTLPSAIDSSIFYSSDSDNFRESVAWVGSLHKMQTENPNEIVSIGPRFGYAHYSGPIVTASGTAMQLMGTYLTKQIDFQLAVGAKNVSHSSDFTKASSMIARTSNRVAELVVRKVKADLKKTGDTLSPEDEILIREEAREEAKNIAPSIISDAIKEDGGKPSGNKTYFVGSMELKVQVNENINLGIISSADMVDSQMAIMYGISYFMVAPTLEHQITDNINLNVILGNNHFTDSNNRVFIRNKLNWVFNPEYGLSTYIRMNMQQDSNPGSPFYYSPENLERITAGFKMRKRYEGLIYSASIEYGKEYATNTIRDFDYTDRIKSNVYYWDVGVQTPPTKERKMTFGISVIGTNVNQSHALDSSNYRWFGASAWIKVPF